MQNNIVINASIEQNKNISASIENNQNLTASGTQRGPQGIPGEAATIELGTVSTGEAGTDVVITNSGTENAAVFNFTIPRGDKGEQGVQGNTGNGIVNTEYVSTSGLADTYHINYTNGNYDSFTVTNGRDGNTSWGSITGSLNNQTDLQTELNGLQSQIDAIVSSSDVFDIVGTYAELQAYDISTVPVNDVIKVLIDSTHDNTATYYRCVEIAGVKSWNYIGAEGAYYTKAESDAKFATFNDLPTVGDGTITIQQDGKNVGTFTTNQNGDTTINLDIATDLNGKADVDGTNIVSDFSTNLVNNMSNIANVYMSGTAMPSNRVVNLSIGASGAQYTMPANGWVLGSSKAWVQIDKFANTDHIISMENHTSMSTARSSVFVPVIKNEVIRFYYTNNPAFVFIYAQGSESEAG